MRRQLRGKTFMVGRVHEYEVKRRAACIDIGTDIGLDDDRKLLSIYDMDVPFNDIDALRGFIDKGDPGRTPAYGLNPQAAAACKEIQDNRILKVMDQRREDRFLHAISCRPHL